MCRRLAGCGATGAAPRTRSFGGDGHGVVFAILIIEEVGQVSVRRSLLGNFDNRQPQRFGEPARAIEQPFGLAGHVALLEVLDQHSGRIALGGKRQGFQSSVAARRAVEMRAMSLATELLVSEGWEVEDVSAVRSYDLLARRGADTQHVEVKGTTGFGGEIQVTAAEVAFARSHRASMRLILVSGIVVTLEDGGDVMASQGAIRSFEGWAPKTDDLTPIAFFCTVPSCQ